MKKKVAWISGATSGIGEATAKLMSQKGFAISIIGRRIEIGKQIAENINKKGGSAIAIKCDISDEEMVKASVDETVEAFGGINVLINNSGMVEVKKLHDYSSSDWDKVMNVNVKSMFFAFKYAYPYLSKNKASYIVNVGSISSFVGQAETPVYTTSKHAVLGLTRSIALDYAKDGIRCNCVCPGITDTPMLREHLGNNGDADKNLAQRLQRVPLGVALSPMDVAKTIHFFSTNESSGITGTSLTIDCGYLAAAEWKTELVTIK